jgi:hypothetical protein
MRVKPSADCTQCLHEEAFVSSRQISAFLVTMFVLAGVTMAQQASPPTSVPVSNQQSTLQAGQRDSQALTVLAQTLNAAGGISAVAAIQDFTASGTVDYYWGDGVSGTVTVKGRGTGEFRVDATLPEGLRTWAVSDGAGFVTEANGSTTQTPYQNAVNFGSLTFPYTYLAAVLQDSSISIAYVGLETQNGAQVQHIQTEKVLSSTFDPVGTISKLTKRDFYIDASTFYVVGMRDMVHPWEKATIDYPHIVQFSNYQQVNGVWCPFLTTEFVNGQQTETIQLSQIAFNTGLQDSDFVQ